MPSRAIVAPKCSAAAPKLRHRRQMASVFIDKRRHRRWIDRKACRKMTQAGSRRLGGERFRRHNDCIDCFMAESFGAVSNTACE